MALMSGQLLRELQELIAALDRRTPHVGRPDEALIASDAAALRIKALRQISDLEGDPLATQDRQLAETSPTAG